MFQNVPTWGWLVDSWHHIFLMHIYPIEKDISILSLAIGILNGQTLWKTQKWLISHENETLAIFLFTDIIFTWCISLPVYYVCLYKQIWNKKLFLKHPSLCLFSPPLFFPPFLPPPLPPSLSPSLSFQFQYLLRWLKGLQLLYKQLWKEHSDILVRTS